MAWLLEAVNGGWGREQLQAWGVSLKTPLIGVNLMNELPVQRRHPHTFRVLASFLDALISDYNLSVVFLANDVHDTQGFDISAARETVSAMKHGTRTIVAPGVYWSPQRMMSLIANCTLTISMRYHFCLFSALQSVPFIALQRSDKVADLCLDLGWPFGTSLETLNLQDLVMSSVAINDHHADTVSRLRLQVSKMRERARMNKIALDRLAA
jgi:polysaccharide pyruvyl transferase WcaK-like protein